MKKLLIFLLITILTCGCTMGLKSPNLNKHIDSKASIDNDSGAILVIKRNF